mgnify:FL=1
MARSIGLAPSLLQLIPRHRRGLADLDSWRTSYSCFSGFPPSYSSTSVQHPALEIVTGLLDRSTQDTALLPVSVNLRY